MFQGCAPVQHSSRAPTPIVEGSTRLGMNIGGVYTPPIFIACPDTPYPGVYAPCDECWRVYTLHASRAPVPFVEWSLHLGMNIWGMYTLAIFIACHYIHFRGVYMTRDEYRSGVHHPNIHLVATPPVGGSIPVALNVGGVYTPPIFITCPYATCPIVYTAHDEWWRGVPPSNIRRVPLSSLSSGFYPLRYLLEGCTPFQYSLRAPIPRVEWSIPLCNEWWRGVSASNIHGVPQHPLSSGLYPLQ